ncbi:hypothetical protein COLU111180_06385 [Cohnella lubricantis]|uniref:Uncharacterized protein n=1 Tax=Cohnella lubricantis TaxID=2163172 RepID=A0A841T976_9BACL|nr:hypothetical protein [Cohnella lubricantis]MBB6677492.1 hypothetical protein [Cohnella lubricantis]MBP2116622.1 hypothetical protein [Cohnella lubricantis]
MTQSTNRHTKRNDIASKALAHAYNEVMLAASCLLLNGDSRHSELMAIADRLSEIEDSLEGGEQEHVD